MSETKLDVSEFNLSVKDNPNIRTNMVIVGLGATGSSFILLLAHFIKHFSRYDIHLYDHDRITQHNLGVSMYGFFNDLGMRFDNDNSKSYSSLRLLHLLSGMNKDSNMNHNKTHYRESKVTERILNRHHKNIDIIFIFTDNNESRHEIAQYHNKHPETIIFDCRVGSYSQFEVYYSNNPSKYQQTIYYEDNGKPMHIEGNNVCLDERMSFTIAMTGASLLMNLFIKYLKDDIKEDFKHIMIGDDYIGEVKGYE